MNGLYIAVAFLALAITALEARMVPQIIGGRDAIPGEFPYQGSLQRLFYNSELKTYNDKHTCGCVLVSTEWLVTAAHCVGDGPGGLTVVMGLHKRGDNSLGKPDTSFITQIISHPKWTPPSLKGDIAMIKVLVEITLNDYVKTIEMHSAGTNLDGSECTITGWGVTTTGGGRITEVLQKAQVTALSVSNCQKYWRNTAEDQICVWEENKRGACNGDSGGPVACNGKLAGVTSFGQKGCFVDTPTVYTRISHYRDWIKRTSGL